MLPLFATVIVAARELARDPEPSAALGSNLLGVPGWRCAGVQLHGLRPAQPLLAYHGALRILLAPSGGTLTRSVPPEGVHRTTPRLRMVEGPVPLAQRLAR